MPKVYDHINPVEQRLHGYIWSRLREIEVIECELADEKKMWIEVDANLNRCPSCGGQGTVRYRIDEDSWGPTTKCPKCGGSGVGPNKPYKAEGEKEIKPVQDMGDHSVRNATLLPSIGESSP
jgi:hypothetical protein